MRRARSWAWWVAGAGLLVLGALLAGAPGAEGPPLDPDSTSPLGTKALVDTLRELDVAVTVVAGAPAPDATTALLLVDDLPPRTRARLASWVEAGGRLVVADPRSPLNPAPPADRPPLPDDTLERDCALPALSQVERVVVPAAMLLEPGPSATACFRREGGAWLVVTPRGGGQVVSLGGPLAFVNRELASADNAVLAVALLAPEPADRVVVLQPPGPGEGDRSLVDLVPGRVKLALAQLVVAFLVVVAWRARRLGRPVAEAEPVTVSGSELVVAVGELLQRARARGPAAAALRDDLRRHLAVRLGLPAAAPPETVAGVVAARTGLAEAEVAEVLSPGDPPDEAALVRLAQRVERVRQDVTHAAR